MRFLSLFLDGFGCRIEGAYRWCGDVRQVSADTGRVDNIVEGELVDESTALQEKGQWLFRRQFRSLPVILSFRTWPIPPEAPATTWDFFQYMFNDVSKKKKNFAPAFIVSG